ncbi:MAG: hypothetical protein M3071_10260 [Actinomycetota bacterium]|nr:hypothetical protein [Actinomycetota bacterium]
MTAAEEQELVEFLERDQLVIDTSRPVNRMVLSRGSSVALWAMRVFVVVVSAMVIYAFASQLVH